MSAATTCSTRVVFPVPDGATKETIGGRSFERLFDDAGSDAVTAWLYYSTVNVGEAGLRAVTSISIFIRLSASPTTIIVAAGSASAK